MQSKKCLMLLLMIFSFFHDCSGKRVGFWSSWGISCGIAMYTKHLSDALIKNGYSVFNYEHTLNQQELCKKIDKDEIDILNIQYDPGLFPSKEVLLQVMRCLASAGIKIVVTLHTQMEWAREILLWADHIIVHKPPHNLTLGSKVSYITMPVPLSTIDKSREFLRKKYGYSENDKILVSTGFMLSDKQPDVILKHLVRFIKKNPRIKLQLLHSFTSRNPDQCKRIFKRLMHVIRKNKIKNQVRVKTDFISQKELAQRIYLSDCGYQWFARNTKATSASAREYISVQTPLVVPSSNHFHDINFEGIEKTPHTIKAFARGIKRMINSPKLSDYRRSLRKTYDAYNYDRLVGNFLEIFDGL